MRHPKKIYRVWMASEGFANGWEAEAHTPEGAIRVWLDDADQPDEFDMTSETTSNVVYVAELTEDEIGTTGTVQVFTVVVDLNPTFKIRPNKVTP